MLYKSQIYDNKDGAIATAEQMRARRIASLKKQISKLEILTFT